jgi:heme/copper-type cytochrome/quinol oxidase subunit 2
MFKLLITLKVTALAVIASMEDRIVKHRRDERGSVTIEQVIWAGAVILIVGIVVAAISAYVTSEAGKIK